MVSRLEFECQVQGEAAGEVAAPEQVLDPTAAQAVQVLYLHVWERLHLSAGPSRGRGACLARGHDRSLHLSWGTRPDHILSFALAFRLAYALSRSFRVYL